MADSGKPSEHSEGILNAVAENIGATLGKLVAKASAAQKTLGETATAVVAKATPTKATAPGKKRAARPAKKQSAKRASAVRKPPRRARSSKKKS